MSLSASTKPSEPTVNASSAAQHLPQLQIETPWAQVAIAWANGKTVFEPLCKVSVRRKSPRTQFITLGVGGHADDLGSSAAAGHVPTTH